jgi:hypothetical protein
MSDTLQTKMLLEGRFVAGEQPHPEKLSILNSLYQAVLVEIKNKLGSVDGANNGALTTSSGNPWFATKTASRYEADGYDIDLDVATTDLQSLYNQAVSVARLLGPAAALNPQFIGQETWLAANQGAGYPLAAGEHLHILPFRPTDPGAIVEASFSPSGGGDIPAYPGTKVFNTAVASLAELQAPGDFFVDAEGVLVSYSPCDSGTTLVYDYSTDQGDQYVNAGFNVIPDPSILKLDLPTRLAAGDPDALTDGTSGSYKACEVSYVSGTDTPVFKIVLPEVIAVDESVLTGNVSVEDFEPGGTWNAGLGSPTRQYLLPEVYERDVATMPATKLLPDNTIFLWDASNNRIVQGFSFSIEAADQLDNSVRVLRASGPAYLVSDTHPDRMLDDAGSEITGGGLNTRDYFLLCIGTQITPLLAQHSKTLRSHNHDGHNSARISHKDLTDAAGASQAAGVGQVIALETDESTLPSQFESEGLTEYFVRAFWTSNVDGNVHPQYFHRLGFRSGGTDGFYADEDAAPANMANMFMGDLVLGPTQNSANDSGYSWESHDLDWDNIGPGHSLWFGIPDVLPAASGGSAVRGYNGSTRTYFDGAIEAEETNASNDIFDAVSRYGIGPSTTTGVTGSVTDVRRGLNIQRGHFFFGFNEHKSSSIWPGAKLSASWLTSDFTVVVSANEQSGGVGQPGFRGQVNGPRDGFLVRAVDGASVYHGIGGTWDVDPADALTEGHKSDFDMTGAYTMEAGFGSGAFVHTSKGLYEDDSAHGAVFLASPGLGATAYFPWQNTVAGNYAGWSQSDPLSATNHENRGGFFQLMSFASKESIESYVPTSTSTPTQSVLGPRSLPWGRGVIGGMLGFDIVVPLQSRQAGDFTHADEENPFNGNGISLPWKPELRIGALLRQDRFLDDAEDRDAVHAGANVNLMYGHGKDYNRFNIDAPWSDTVDGFGRTSETGNATTINDPGKVSDFASVGWTRARAGNLVSGDTEDYGSNVRQASTVEAFNGFRSDPTQPYISTYKIPFVIKRRINQPGGNLDEELGAVISTLPLVESDDKQISVSTYYKNNPHFALPINAQGRFTDQQGFHLFVDQIIRWHDAKLSVVKGSSDIRPGESLAGFNVDLNYYYFKEEIDTTNDIYESEGQGEAAGAWLGIRDGSVSMVRVGDSGWADNADNTPRPVMVGSAYPNYADSDGDFLVDSPAKLRPYGAYLAIAPVNTVSGSTTKDEIGALIADDANSSLEAYYLGFPGFDGNSMTYQNTGGTVDFGWCVVLHAPNIDPDTATGMDGAFPFKLTEENFGGEGLAAVLEFSGVITLQFRSLSPYTEFTI